MSVKFRVYFATPDDIDLLVAHRMNMWRDIHPELDSKIDESEKFTRDWIGRRLAAGRLVGFIAKAAGGKVAGSGCLWVREEQPRPTNPRQEVPYLMSMYTEKEFRRKGVAKLIVKSALKWCRDHKYERIVLHASEAGKPLYQEFGFESSSEMRLKL